PGRGGCADHGARGRPRAALGVDLDLGETGAAQAVRARLSVKISRMATVGHSHGEWDVISLTAELVAIDSVNPDLIAGAAGEEGVARHVAEWCAAAGLEVVVEEVAPGRPNVVALARGSGGGRSLLLNAHTDTVGVAGMEAPFSARMEEDRLYGRGAYDMKGSLAEAMVAAARARRLGLRGDVILAAVVDEEVGSIGTERLVEVTRADAAIVAEPTDLRVCAAHKGFL